MNNLPAALLTRSALQGADVHDAQLFGALLGLNIGPTILPTGSLATLLVLEVARRKGENVTGVEILKIGAWLTPLVLVLSSLALAVVIE